MAGTAFKATKKAASVMLANALMPARISSLFLAEFASFPARTFRSSRTVNSTLGIVKLSRTNFGFLALANLSTWGLVGAFGVAFEAIFLLTLLAGLVGALSALAGDLRGDLSAFLTGDVGATAAVTFAILASLPCAVTVALGATFTLALRGALTAFASLAIFALASTGETGVPGVAVAAAVFVLRAAVASTGFAEVLGMLVFSVLFMVRFQ